jgi:hypothetical protein
MVFWDDDIGDLLHGQYLADLEHAREIELESFRRRGIGGRLLEQASRLIVRLL